MGKIGRDFDGEGNAILRQQPPRFGPRAEYAVELLQKPRAETARLPIRRGLFGTIEGIP